MQKNIQILAFSHLKSLYNTNNREEEITFEANPNFPAHLSGIEENKKYICKGGVISFQSGNHELFLEFKNHLSKIAGFDDYEHIWRLKPLGYFVEFIYFTDDKGSIGPIISSKLYKDFSDNFQQAKEYFDKIHNGNTFFALYQNWKKAFYFAKNHGAISISS